MASTYKLTEKDLDGLAEMLRQMVDLDTATGGTSWKAQARERGFTYYVTFANKVPVIPTTQQFVALIDQAPERLALVIRKVLFDRGRVEESAYGMDAEGA